VDGRPRQARNPRRLGRRRKNWRPARRILITHEHTDHCTAPQMLVFWKAAALRHRAHLAPMRGMSPDNVRASGSKRVETSSLASTSQSCDMTSHAFPIPHDAVIHRIHAFVRTARKWLCHRPRYMPEACQSHLRGAEALVLESNHDPTCSRSARIRGSSSNASSAAPASFNHGRQRISLAIPTARCDRRYSSSPTFLSKTTSRSRPHLR